MSICDDIQQGARFKGRLFPVGHTIGFSVVRPIYASIEIERLLYGEKQDQDWKNRIAALGADFDRYLDGNVIHAALSDPNKPYARKQLSLVRQLWPASGEVWEIRNRNMKPTIRIFGRFAAKDWFIALTWATRPELKEPASPHWKQAIADCSTKWDELFNKHPPLTRVNLHDYISNAISL